MTRLLIKGIFILSITLFPSNKAFADEHLLCLAKVVYHEARGESLDGKIAVANVVLNRVKSDLFPDSICSVVYQPNQFTDIEKRTDYSDFKSESWGESFLAASLVYLKKKVDNTGEALFYLNPKKVNKNLLTKWRNNFKLTHRIDNHEFYTIKEKHL
jgi:N-acetylmuramoyl-L-alanine amidase